MAAVWQSFITAATVPVPACGIPAVAGGTCRGHSTDLLLEWPSCDVRWLCLLAQFPSVCNACTSPGWGLAHAPGSFEPEGSKGLVSHQDGG